MYGSVTKPKYFPHMHGHALPLYLAVSPGPFPSMPVIDTGVAVMILMPVARLTYFLIKTLSLFVETILQ